MELDVWTSSEVTHVERDEAKDEWVVTVVKTADNTKRVFRPKYVVLAFGLAGNTPRMPVVPGKEKFKGQVLHSTQHKRALDHEGKKVVVVGACTSGETLTCFANLMGL